jgi:VWFA-related protein
MNGSTSRPGARRLALVIVLLTVAGAIGLVADQQGVFRSTVDLIAVDVQVVDSEGFPIGTMGPDAFEVSIEGKRRKVVSAEFIRHAPTAQPGRDGRGTANGIQDDGGPLTSAGRTVIIGLDNGSFDTGTARRPVGALLQFIAQFDEHDRVGLYVFPGSAWIPPTTQRAPLRVRLERVTGERQPIRSFYNLKPYEIVDITAQWSNPNSFLTNVRARGRGVVDASALDELDPVLRVQRRECPDDADCPMRIYSEGMLLAVQLERQAQLSLAGLQTLLAGLGDIPGRKIVVLMSAGVLVSDRLDARPDVGDLARVLGQMAAHVNATIYTIHLDTNNAGANVNAASQKGNSISDLGGRDRALFGNWLEQFSASAGGRRIYVPVGEGEFAFDRVLRETSGYYLLGVEPAPVDQDGRPHRLDVKVSRRSVSVRNRQWVVVPTRKTS